MGTHISEVDYIRHFYGDLAPSFLEMLLTFSGYRAPDISGAFTYCDLGCGHGLTTNILAAANPNGQFYANDFNSSHIEQARKLASATGNKNIWFFDDDLRDFANRDLPGFDFIVLHGVFTWVPDDVRAAIIDFIARKLNPGGVVFVSYNSLPGWAPLAPLRELLNGGTELSRGSTIAQLGPAIGMIERLRDSNAGYFVANPTAHHQIAGLGTADPGYVIHEYLATDMRPFYHREVSEMLRAAGVTYVTSADPKDHIDALNLTQDEVVILADIDDPVRRETIRDFMINQTFRRDLFMKDPQWLDPDERSAGLNHMRFVATASVSQIPAELIRPRMTLSLPSEIFEPIQLALSLEARTVAELVNFTGIDQQTLLQSLMILFGCGYIRPCRQIGGLDERHIRCTQFNRSVLSGDFGTINFLASPITGSGHLMTSIMPGVQVS